MVNFINLTSNEFVNPSTQRRQRPAILQRREFIEIPSSGEESEDEPEQSGSNINNDVDILQENEAEEYESDSDVENGIDNDVSGVNDEYWSAIVSVPLMPLRSFMLTTGNASYAIE